MIHKTHTRRDIIGIIETFNFKITDYKDVSKPKLFEDVWNYIETIQDFKNIEEERNIKHLKEYLSSVNQNRIKISERDKYIDIAKMIIFYVDNGCLLSYTNYLNEDDLLNDVKLINNYCKLPTCLRAINLLNKTHKFKRFEPVLTGKTKVMLRKREQKRLKQMNNLRVRRLEDNDGKPFVVNFD